MPAKATNKRAPRKGRPPAENPLNVPVRVNFSEADYDLIVRVATMLDRSVASTVRKAALDGLAFMETAAIAALEERGEA